LIAEHRERAGAGEEAGYDSHDRSLRCCAAAGALAGFGGG
jgi:hypothetical protein